MQHPVRQWMDVLAEAKGKGRMGYWDLIAHYKLDLQAKQKHDKAIPWLNRNNPRPVDEMVRSPKYRLVSKIQFYFKKVLQYANYATPASSPEQFEAALSTPVTVWRGGGGTYDPKHDVGRRWVSFTASKERVGTFSKYNGTFATRAFMLPKRAHYWIVELTLPLDEILAYLPEGWDEEIIVSAATATRAKLVEQT